VVVSPVYAAETLDAGALDAGALDAGALDAGTLDAGALDAGTLDAGAQRDVVAAVPQDVSVSMETTVTGLEGENVSQETLSGTDVKVCTEQV
jgi:hypothetical protein